MLKKEIEIEAPVEKIWSIFADVEKNTEWVDGVLESSITSPNKDGLGLCWDEKCKIAGQTIDVSHEFTVWDPGKAAEIKTELPMGGWMKRNFEFEGVEDKTQIKVDFEWDLGIAGMMLGEDKATAFLDESFEITLENLKNKLEAPTST